MAHGASHKIEMLSCLEGKRCLHAVKKSTLDVSFTSSHFGRVWLRMDHSGAFLELSLQKTTFKYLEAITICNYAWFVFKQCM